ncbi:PDZ domain-containing protein, partial [Klebsiella pneumoniae]|uniref:PDZ domain-containing protein n=1 Tax=Klebsiella pneumoniae TaxID=573 RepID=UPI00190F5D8C
AGERAGLQVGDTVLQINGQAVEAWQQVVNAIQSHPNAPSAVMVERAGQQVELTLIPDSRELSQGKVIGFAGIAPKVAEWPQNYRFELQFGVFESLGKAVEKSGQVIDLTVSMLKKRLVGDVG